MADFSYLHAKGRAVEIAEFSSWLLVQTELTLTVSFAKWKPTPSAVLFSTKCSVHAKQSKWFGALVRKKRGNKGEIHKTATVGNFTQLLSNSSVGQILLVM